MPMLAIEGMVVVILCGYDLCCVVWPDGMTCGEDARLKSLDFERVAQLSQLCVRIISAVTLFCAVKKIKLVVC